MIRATGAKPIVIEYLTMPPDRATLMNLVHRMGLPLRGLLREKGTPFAELGLDDPALSDDALLAAIEAHPILINRPIVVTQGRAPLPPVRDGAGCARHAAPG